MSLELTALPLAFLAGMAGILSPCVWPLVPVVIASSATTGRFGPLALAAGLSLSFAVAGSVLMFFLVNAGLDPELFRYLAAFILLAAGIVLVIKTLANRMTLSLSILTSRLNIDASTESGYGQFGVGILLGVVWLPCVGPTLGRRGGLVLTGFDKLLQTWAVQMLPGWLTGL
ncbi:cytochrome c biogenesis CcdA family protein [Microbulbifer rhizosphaerae]|uniref:Cytochrome c biogenesis protein CcdA n=1 Tax=Microbulbifer rhizosphaerae TaxID=1562603 RepID=A0A7W4ZAG7_9GAMM|nr:cytochrome c biogenesis protein CcdA [Microbulbifer rhizosphaerae]MBB3061319.1 cytochrome c biogenesis protein CcdA [Microbulbifer rhizosphaerae]